MEKLLLLDYYYQYFHRHCCRYNDYCSTTASGTGTATAITSVRSDYCCCHYYHYLNYIGSSYYHCFFYSYYYYENCSTHCYCCCYD